MKSSFVPVTVHLQDNAAHNKNTDGTLPHESLPNSEHLFSSLLEFSNDIILLSNEQGLITYVSPSIKKIMGYGESELVGKPGLALIHPDFIEDVMKSAASLQQPGSRTTYELLFLHKDGSWRWVESNVSNLLHVPSVNAFVSNFRDITERKHISEQLQYAATLTENIADAVIGTDLNYIINSWNKGAEKMYGWIAEEAIGREATPILKTKFSTEQERKQLHQVLNTKEFWQGEVMQQRKDGTSMPVLASVAYVKDKHGKRIGTVAVNRDITAAKKEEQVLKETKDQLELTFNNVPAGIFLFNKNGNILFVNDNAARLYGYSSAAELMIAENLITIRDKARELFDVQDEKGRPLALENSATAISLKTGKAKQLVYKTTNKVTGEVLWTLSSAAPLLDVDGNLSMVLTTNTDITLQKLAEKEIRQSEERFRTLAEALPQLVWITDAAGVQEYTSKRWPEYTGLDPAIEDVWQQLVHPEDMSRVMNVWNESLKTGTSYNAEVRLKTKDNTYRWNYIQGEPLKNERDEIVKWAGAFTDIHEQKMAEEKIRESEENFKQLADLVPQIIWTARADGYLEYYNKRWYEYTGFKKGFGDESWIPVVHPEELDDCINKYYHSIKTGEPYQIEYRLKDKATGGYRWFLGKALPVRDNDGAIIKWFGTCTDIHDQKLNTENLEMLIKQRTEELQRSNEDLQQFAHVTSHDMQEPLRKIQIFGGRVLNTYGEALPEQAKMFIEKMSSSANRLSDMVNSVLKFSSANSVGELTDIDLNEIIQAIEVDLEVAMQQKGAVINTGKLPIIQGSPALINQLFYNLLNNCLKFSHPDRNPVINITSILLTNSEVRRMPGLTAGVPYVKIEVKDNGIGFDQKFAESIFKTFTRLHSKNEYEGTGLGLALCKKIVSLHKGSITAKSKENEGATFYITLPAKAM